MDLRTFSEFDALTPSIYFGAPQATDEVTREIFRSVYPVLVDENWSDYDLGRFATAAFYYPSVFAKSGRELSKMTACEIGAGTGMKASAWAPLFKKYIAVDVLPNSLAYTESLARRVGLNNIETCIADGAAFLRENISEIDVLILYAVFEHLTLSEREEILLSAEAVIQRDGLVLLAECPNRLIPSDPHTSQLPFFQQLPDDLALRYLDRSPRFEILERENRWASSPQERLYRMGRGASFHEFDAFCPKIGYSGFAIVADGYDVAGLNIEPIRSEEIYLDHLLTEIAIAPPRAFSRYWIELLAHKGQSSPPRQRLRMAKVAAGSSRRVPLGSHWDFDRTVVPTGYTVELENSVSDSITLTFDLFSSEGMLVVWHGTNVVQEISFSDLKRSRPPTWHSFAAALVHLPTHPDVVRLEVRGNDGQAVLGPAIF
ncbi:class I SAM-dependent methyltransferase [Microvirga sp. BT688]|uniref:class I SAM-dependent methyltransferase n=1 Tax=Microvirga sp. TaxID=1873136 RepID=UPI00168238F9|nr:class I SAM-dependent methyltransferase [Microvirga sp.]MBD2750011.1 class I SAM-dependent methyltransferase [Microvirga sp.]